MLRYYPARTNPASGFEFRASGITSPTLGSVETRYPPLAPVLIHFLPICNKKKWRAKLEREGVRYVGWEGVARENHALYLGFQKKFTHDVLGDLTNR